MDGSRFLSMTVLSLALTLAISQPTWSQYYTPPKPDEPRRPETYQLPRAVTYSKPALICKIYPLSDLSDDPTLGKWIAETIPTVVQPSSWDTDVNGTDRRSLSYFAPGKVLVVCHTAAAHAQVEEFLKNLKSALPRKGAMTARVRNGQTNEPALLQAKYSQAEAGRAPETMPVNKSTAYPIPAPLSQPKHLFHMVFRYEGEGALDAAIGDITKALNRDSLDKDDKTSKQEKDDADKCEKANQTSQLLHFIVRYEGDGIIDENVRKFLTKWLGKSSAKAESEGNPSVAGFMPSAYPAPGKRPANGDEEGNSRTPPAPSYAVPPVVFSGPFSNTSTDPPQMPLADEPPVR